MRSVAQKLSLGIYHFGSSTINTPEFNSFFELFKRSFKRELNKIKAKNIVFNKLHFGLSGFFTVQDKVVYFSISDVRTPISNYKSEPEMLFRLADNYQDYKGHANRYVTIKSDMSKQILYVLNLDTKQFYKESPQTFPITKKIEKATKKLREGENFVCKVPSMTKANSMFWRIADNLFGESNFSISVWKNGRRKISSEASYKGLKYNYDAYSKTFEIKS
jgi:hypothetical protein